jgi:uncharacterized protein YgiM (DUF1202 family)
MLIRSTAVLAVVALIALGIAAGPHLAGAQDDTAWAVGDSLVVDTDALSLRSDASIDADVLAVLETGAAVAITGDAVTVGGYDWYPVDTDSGSGYVAGEFLSTSVTISTSLGFAIGDSLVVNTDALNLRGAATVTGELLATLTTGDAVTIVDGPIGADGYTWYEVDSDNGTGWVAGDYLAATQTVSNSVGLSVGAAVYVDTDGLNLRDDASTSGNVLAVLESGAGATITGGPVSADSYT